MLLNALKFGFFYCLMGTICIFITACGGVSRQGHRSGTPPKVAVKNVSHDPDMKGLYGDVAETTEHATKKKIEKWNVTADKVAEIAPLVSSAAKENNISEDLIYAVIWVESRFNPNAVSPVGARGLMQLMPKTASYLAECIGWSGRHNTRDPRFNIAAGSYYIARLIKQFDGDEDLALAAYNAGPGNIAKWMKNTGLPKVSIEYYTMVQTARGYFGQNNEHDENRGNVTDSRHPSADEEQLVVSSDDLDKLGLAILIAGLSSDQFGLERTDDENPFK